MKKTVLYDTQDAMREYGLAHIPPAGKVVEVGCNTGATTAPYFINTPDRYIGIDNQKAKILAARKAYPQLTFAYVDCLMPKGKKIIQKADILISFQTLEHIGTPRGDEDILLLSWLKKDTKVIISVPNFNSMYHMRFYNEHIWTKRFNTVLAIEEIRTYQKKQHACSYLYIGYRK